MIVKKFFLLPIFIPFLCTATSLPAIRASQRGDLKSLKALLASQEVTLRPQKEANSNGATPLHFAAYAGYLAIVQTLLQNSFPINAQVVRSVDFDLGKNLSSQIGGVTPLMLAACNGHEKVVAALIATGARVNSADDNGQTALHYAILGDQNWPHQPLDAIRKKIIRMLLHAGADPRIQDEHGNDALYYYQLVASLALQGRGYISDPEIAQEDQLYQEMRS